MNKLKGILIGIIVVLTFAFATGCTLSAYDVAVRNGFVGTEQQWLESLKGVDGTDGSDLTINDIYNRAVENGYAGSYLDFLHEYLSFEEAPDNSAAISKGLRSAVLVYCKFTKNRNFWSEASAYAQAGAGVIYRLNKEAKSAYIITNYHVVYSSDADTADKISNDISVTPYGGEKIDVTYIGGSAKYDIAVLKAENSYFASDVAAAVSVNTEDVTVGQTVIAIGNPAGEGISATQGIVSVDSENIVMSAIDNSSANVVMRVMRIDAAVNSGNSGGGLFDGHGNLIGIVNAKVSDTSIENMAYAIPSSIATSVADNIIKNNGFRGALVGISVIAKSSRAYLSDGLIKVSETVAVYEVTPGSAASGLLKTGDIILSVDDKEVTRTFHVGNAIIKHEPGDTVTFKIVRAGEEMSVNIVCGE